VPSCQALRDGGCEPIGAGLTPGHWLSASAPKRLERRTRAGESPVDVRLARQLSELKYHATREIAWEAGATTPQG
jgi:hypothetical protein